MLFKILIIILEILAIIGIIYGFNRDLGLGISLILIDILINLTIIKIILK